MNSPYLSPTPLLAGEAVEVPSLLSAVVTRIEVKGKNDAADMAGARAIFGGIMIEGPTICEMPEVDLLSGFDEQVAQEALKRMDETKASVPYSKTIVAPGQEPGKDVPYLYHASGTKKGLGGPATSHSAYESMFTDASGETLEGSKGEYVQVTEAPPVNAFRSVTLYDTENGFFIPNDRKKYSVGADAGMRLDDDGGIAIYIAAEKPPGVPEGTGCRSIEKTPTSDRSCACTNRISSTLRAGPPPRRRSFRAEPKAETRVESFRDNWKGRQS
jgi:hypothetical protein